MAKLYLFVLSDKLDRDQVIDSLISDKAIDKWFYNINGTFFAYSEYEASKLSKLIQKTFGKQRHFITNVSENRQGILPTDHWKLIYKE
jgi:hypothetical protein